MAHTASHAVTFAKLYTPDGICHGLHSFVVQIRDLETWETLPGITVGDMGKKLGLNGLDNGWVYNQNVKKMPFVMLKNLLDFYDFVEF